jgi:hypothetical protein
MIFDAREILLLLKKNLKYDTYTLLKPNYQIFGRIGHLQRDLKKLMNEKFQENGKN